MPSGRLRAAAARLRAAAPTPLANRRHVKIKLGRRRVSRRRRSVVSRSRSAHASQIRHALHAAARPRSPVQRFLGVGHDARVRIPCRRHRATLFAQLRAPQYKMAFCLRRARLTSTRFAPVCAGRSSHASFSQMPGGFKSKKSKARSSGAMSRWHAAVDQDAEDDRGGLDNDPASDATSAYHSARVAHTPCCSAS